MKIGQKTALIIICLTGMGVSFIYHLLQDADIVGEIKAPVNVNIEIDKTYMRFISVVATLNGGDTLYQLSPTTDAGSPLRSIVLYTTVREGVQVPFIHALFLRIPQERAAETLGAIDGAGIFIGNKAFYFAHSDIAALRGMEQGDYLLYKLPGLEYKKSFMGRWINWYGDFNLGVKTILAFFLYPAKFIITWLFLICFLAVCGSVIADSYRFMQKQNRLIPELLLLVLILIAGFILRFNGFIRYSAHHDELYSACVAANIGRPFLSTFEDPGNPPFYFILLRFWFGIFGWTEQSGRFLSVVLGSAAIISLYVMVKRFAGRKAALLAAVFMAVNTYLIGYSQFMRAYILEVFLVSIMAFRFLIFVQRQTIANLVWYIITAVLLANTHYYGSLFVFAGFVFYVFDAIERKTFIWKKTILFFAGNAVIALSLLPFSIHTALRQALFNKNFNTWIAKPLYLWKELTVFFLLFLIFRIFLRKTVFRKLLSVSECRLLDYSFFTTAASLFMAFGFSLYRPIMVKYYFIIFLPFVFAVIAVIISGIFRKSSKTAAALCAVFAFVWTAGGYKAERRNDGNNVYHESLVYILRDAESHADNKSVELRRFFYLAELYGYTYLPLYVPGDTYDVLFFNPSHNSEQDMYSRTANIGISPEKILQIRVNETSSVFKIYP
jgi:hypothetical protein